LPEGQIPTNNTVDGKNPAPPDMLKTLQIMGYLRYQLVQDFSINNITVLASKTRTFVQFQNHSSASPCAHCQSRRCPTHRKPPMSRLFHVFWMPLSTDIAHQIGMQQPILSKENMVLNQLDIAINKQVDVLTSTKICHIDKC